MMDMNFNLEDSPYLEQDDNRSLEIGQNDIETQSLNLEQEHIEAPDDKTQVERSVESIEQIEGVKFDEWKELSVEERVDVLQQIEDAVSEVACRPACPVNARPLGEGNYGGYNPETGEITVNTEYLTSNYEDYAESIDTIVHEGRHAYQTYNVYVDQIHPSNGDVNNWYENYCVYGYQDPEIYGFKDYYIQPVEADARKFAEDVKDKLLAA